jgi:molecular chaperone DnaK (HSP70)
MVAFTKEQLCGEGAESQQPKNPKNTVYDVKRLMGVKFSSE